MFLYTSISYLAFGCIKILSIFKPKLKQFVNGRKHTATFLKTLEKENNNVVFHCASLGEFEQGLPVMEAWQKHYPDDQIIVTFFSPSGYEVKKNHSLPKHILYLPWDVPSQVNLFLDNIQPKYFFFVKYELWPCLIQSLNKRKIPTFLISAIFRDHQIFFKPYGFWMKNILRQLTHIFTQNETSEILLKKHYIHQVTYAGDTRFDRVLQILNNKAPLEFVSDFKQNKLLVVIGSSWEKDEVLWSSYINRSNNQHKYLIAPHNINMTQIKQLKQSFNKPTILYSEIDTVNNLESYQVLIVDTVGLLTKIYAYADIAYVGGGFGHPGVHNILEPACFGIPVISGPKIIHFYEAIKLQELGGLICIKNLTELTNLIQKLEEQPNRDKIGQIGQNFVEINQGATNKIINYFKH